MKNLLATFRSGSWRQPSTMLYIMAAAMPFSFGVWSALINNFAIEQAAFTGADMGALQSLREVPGFLSFTVIFLLIIFREQTLAVVALLVMGFGVVITGMLPSFWGLCITTLIMSIGFHYFEAVNQSLQLQWLDKKEAPEMLGKLISVGAMSSLLAYSMVYIALEYTGASMMSVYIIGGGVTMLLAVFAWTQFPHFPAKVEQNKHLVLRKRYWLYYVLVFMSGSRRQIFVVFAGFLMVEKFGFTASQIALMFLANMVANIYIAPKIGRLISYIGERRTLTIEYIGLILVFVGYAVVESAAWAVALYILDHLFFAMAIAMKTYFQKIASPADIAPTAGISFTISHIAAIVVPIGFGLIWLHSPSIVFYAGAGMAAISLVLARMVPENPAEGAETRFVVARS
ncbi:MFS transporter [Leucothrix pacifica]|uniref:MFS transporter n=1 Tax=Leucothrix pacifica TaxID=1247513 RepID=A0A317CVZ0_9GAMM|nr:MFS transporter [Leucothrix pacifica]PWR00681.1 MFS transporter [Leucothrix pacifica]